MVNTKFCLLRSGENGRKRATLDQGPSYRELKGNGRKRGKKKKRVVGEYSAKKRKTIILFDPWVRGNVTV